MHAWVAAALLTVLAPAPPVAPRIEGDWSGAVEVGGARLRLVLHVVARPQGGFAARLDSIDQGAHNLPVDEVTMRDRTVSLRMKQLGASYSGTVSDDGAAITGEWIQGGAFPLVFRRGAPEPLRRPQEPKGARPYRDEEVTFESAGLKLAGTLTVPKDKGPFPAVVLVSGSGPQDRDETISGHRPFLVLADHLARQGVAVLRYDDRGVGKSTGSLAATTTLDYVGDVKAALATLRVRPEIDAKRLGVIGHSEGSLVAALVAAQDPELAFVVLLEGPGVAGEPLLYEQAALMARAGGATPEMIAQQKAMQEQVFAVVKEERDPAAARKKIAEVLGPAFAQAPEAQKAAALDAQAAWALSPWMRHFLAYDPLPTLRTVKCPVLAVFGEKDLQVPPAQNAPPVEAALKAAGNRDSAVRRLPGLNHLLQTAGTGLPGEYGAIEETMAPAALGAVGQWIAQRTRTIPPR
jgi:pimeloyl-ACP methyl ester carboxylesterase